MYLSHFLGPTSCIKEEKSMKNLKKIIAIVLVCILAFSALQVTASAASAADAVKQAASALADTGISISMILVGILYAFFPILIVIDLISVLVSGNAIIGGNLIGMLG